MRIGVVEAGSGYGKSALAAELRSELEIDAASAVLGPRDGDAAFATAAVLRAVRAAGMTRAAARMEAADGPPGAVTALLDELAATAQPTLLIIDDVHHAEGSAAPLLLQLVTSLPEPHRVLLLGRWLPGSLRRLQRDASAVSLDSTTLAMTPDEIAALCRDGFGVDLTAAEARTLHQVTDGWTALVVLAARRLAGASDRRAVVADLATRPTLLTFLLNECLGAMAPDDRDAVVQLAHLPMVTSDVATVAGGDDLLTRASAAGVPFTRDREGRWELPGPVEEFLRGLAPASAEVAERAAEVYRERGETLHAFDVLIAAGAGDRAAAMIADLEPKWLDRLDLSELEAAVAALPESAIAAHPRVLLHVARASEPAAQLERRTVLLRRALRLAVEQQDDELAREIDAEFARDLIRDGHATLAASLASAVLVAAGDNEAVTRIRALDAYGRATTLRGLGDDAALAAAAALLSEALRLCRQQGRKAWAAQVALPLALWVHFARGHYDLALLHIDGALRDLPVRSRQRAVILTFRADVLLEVGRAEEAAADLTEAGELATLFGDERALAYVAWEWARQAAQRGDVAATVRWVREVERHAADWFVHATGAEFLADAADLLDRVGETALAWSYLRKARERADESPVLVAMSEAGVLTRSGDPAEASAVLERLRRSDELPPRERWRVTLLSADIALRMSDPEAGQLAARAFEQAAALGDGLPFVRERATAERLVGLAADAGSSAAAALASRDLPLAVRLLGEFTVERGGRPQVLAPGQPTDLVKIIAAHGGELHAERLMEYLWPEVDPASGRKRLRNVLARLQAGGDVLVRRGETIALVPGAEVDALVFEEHARRALAAPGDDAGAAAVARAALRRYRGDLLPGDPYAEWAVVPRERLRRLRLRLLDLVAADALQRGEYDAAIEHLEVAIDVDPEDEERYVRAARVLLGQGRTSKARGFIRRARTQLDQLGLPPSPTLLEIERRVGAAR